MQRIAVNGNAAVLIEPVQAKYLDTEKCTILSAKIDDNLENTCNVYWSMLYAKTFTITTSDDTTSDITEYISCLSNQSTIMGDDYIKWNGDTEYVFNYVATQLGLIIKD